MPRFPAAFRPAGIRLLAIRSRRGSWSFLAVGLPGRTRTPTGFSRSARPETRPARVPSVPRGHGVLTADASSPAAVAASLRQALPPALRPISRGHCHEASDEGIACAHPSGLPLACGPRMERGPLGFLPRCFEPRRCQRRTSGVGTDHEHFSGAHRRLHADPPFSELTEWRIGM